MKTREEYLEKIEKLLKLSESPVETEAEAALLKARELMAKHKIDMQELNLDKGPEKIVWLDTKVSYGGRRDPWVENLATVIAKNMCCRFVRLTRYRKQTYRLQFVGFESDAETCRRAFEYAYDFIQAHISDEIAKPLIKALKVDYRTKSINQLCNSYGFGFVNGLTINFQNQWKNMETEECKTYEMVLVTPKEVISEVDANTKTVEFYQYSASKSENLDVDMFYKGVADGKEFDVNRKFVEA